MQATKHLPTTYRAAGMLDLSANRPVMLGLSAASLVVLLRPERAASSVRFGLGELAVALAALVALMLGVPVLHELAHDVAMSAVMRERPVFGVRPLYAYAAAPEWYFPRRPL